jgi:hypothetical protein
MWTYPAYRWPDEATGRAAIAAQGWETGTPPGVDLMVIGTWYPPPPPIGEGEPQPDPVPEPGWWLACAFRDRSPPAEWSAAGVALLDGMPRFGVPTMADYQAAIDGLVQATARSRGYNDGTSCAGYALDPDPMWSAEAVVFIAWRSAIWKAVYAALAAVQGGQAPAPSVEALIASLPAIGWPA